MIFPLPGSQGHREVRAVQLLGRCPEEPSFHQAGDHGPLENLELLVQVRQRAERAEVVALVV